jgi:hypothetical protein
VRAVLLRFQYPQLAKFSISTMFSRVALRSSSRVALAAPSVRCFGDKGMTAYDALSRSGYNSIDYTIKEDATVYDAVHKFAAFNIGCLVTVDGGKYLHGSNRWLLVLLSHIATKACSLPL